MTYRPPLRDIRFALDEVVAMDGLKTTGAFDELSGDVAGAVLEEAGRLASEVLAPLNETGDREGCRLENGVVRTASGFAEAYTQYADGGWLGLSFPETHGGAGLPRALAVLVSEMTHSANMSFGLCPMLTLGTIEALAAHGSEELRRVYMPKLVSGEWTGAMNLTEPQAGSDVGALKTRAVANGDGTYAIEGQKIFITWGDHDVADNVIHLVLARLPDAPAGAKGVSLFLVPKVLVKDDGGLGQPNDVRCIGLEGKLGIHASPTCTLAFGESGGATGYLVGEENAGMRCMFTMMNSARLHVGGQGVAIAERAYQQALAFAQERRQGRGADGDYPARIIDHPDVRRMLTTMKMNVEAGRAICLATAVAADYATHSSDADERAAAKAREDLLTPIAKAWCTDMGVEAASLNIQIHGGMGFIEETGAAQLYRDARIAPIYEGTNGIQAIDLVGRKLAGDRGAAMRALLADISTTVEDMELSSNSALPPIAKHLSSAASALERCAAWLIAPGREEADRLAGAGPFLHLAADVVGGYFLCIGAVAAQRRLKDAGGEDAYAQSKIDLARFHAETVLSGAPGREGAVTAGAETLFNATGELLAS